MVIKDTEVFAWFPKDRNTQVKVEINGTDYKSRTVESEFRRPITVGIGDFFIRKGDTVKFYADNTDATTLKFWGRIDYPKEVITKDGQFLEIEGRHRSFLATETQVSFKATDVEASTLLINIVNEFLGDFGFTTNNVNATSGKLMTVNWDYKPFWDAVIEICNRAGFDCYVDNDLDFHLFEENSIMNYDEAIVEGHTFLGISGWGVDDYFNKTRVTAIGQMSDGVTPIIYTAISPTEQSDEIREAPPIVDSSANTFEQVKNLADAELAQFTDRPPQAHVTSHGLETLVEGENLWVVLKRNKIMDGFKALEVTDRFGMKVPGWRTITTIEKEIDGTEQLIQRRAVTEQRIQQASNPNKLDFSFNFEFDDATNIATLTNAVITGGFLKATAASSNMVTTAKTSESGNVTRAELRFQGIDMGASTVQISADGGQSFTNLIRNEVVEIPEGVQGDQIVMKVIFVTDTENPNPQLDNCSILHD
jgi:hypothetical protein